MVGGVGTLLRKGVVAAGGVLAGAMVREFLPGKPTPEPEAPATPATKPAATPQPPSLKPLKVQQTQTEIDTAITKALNSSDAHVRLEGQVPQELRNAGFQVIGFRNKIGPNGSITEIDVETPQAIIEVTVSKQGRLGDVEIKMNNIDVNPSKKPVILFAPKYDKLPENSIVKAGASVVRSTQELMSRLRSMKAK